MDENEDLYKEYVKILDELDKIDKQFVKTTDQTEILSLIEQREPLHEHLTQIYGLIMQGDKQEREAIIKQAKKVGGLAMKGKTIRMHQNGVKIPVSKSYIDDKLLDPKAKYTVILLPE